MANIETLIIEIDGNASRAVGSINSLITSISNLGSTIQGQIGSLRAFASALSSVSRAASRGGGAFSGITSGRAAEGMARTADGASRYAEAMRDVRSAIERGTPEFRSYGDAVSHAADTTREFASASREVGTASTAVHATDNAFAHLFGTIGRLTRTMLLRQAIRAVMKLAKQGLQNYYQYSKSITGTFASAARTLQVDVATAGNQLGAAIGSLLASLAPLLSAILSVVNAIVEALTMLFSALGGNSTYSKANASLDSIGKSAGGAGGKMKELLASFDELNVITQQSGGGGGGSSGDFGFDFQEMEIPQWLQDWAPIIKDGLIAGGIALALSTIWGWLKKIFGIGVTPEAIATESVLTRTAGDVSTIAASSPSAATGLGSMKTAMTGMTVPPGFTTFATEVGATALAAPTAAAGIEAMAVAIPKLTAALGGLSLVTGLISAIMSLLGSLAGSIKIGTNIDKKGYEELKEDIKEFCKDPKTITFEFDKQALEQLWSVANSINEYVARKTTKIVHIKFNETELIEFWKTANEINDYADKKLKKTIGIGFNDTEYNVFWQYAYAVYDYVYGKHNKTIGIAFDPNQYALFFMNAMTITTYLNNKANKVVGIEFNPTQYNIFWQQAYAVYDYVFGKHNKTVGIAFNETQYNLFWQYAYAIYDYVYGKHNKVIGVSLDLTNWSLYKAFVDSWVSKKENKIIYVWLDFHYWNLYKPFVDNWVSYADTKVINISFQNIVLATGVMAFVDAWAGTNSEKGIYIVFENMFAASAIMSMIEEWANTPLTKVINVVIRQTSKGTVSSATIGSGAAAGVLGMLNGNKDATQQAIDSAIQSIRDNLTINPDDYLGSVLISQPNISTSSNGSRATNFFDSMAEFLLNSTQQDAYYGTKDSIKDLIDSISHASGAYGIPSGDLFIANEQGAELIGNINGHTSVANQGQIIEGISRGVENANETQNALLRQQNELLRGILEKDSSVRLSASAALGRVAQQSLDMYSRVGG